MASTGDEAETAETEACSPAVVVFTAVYKRPCVRQVNRVPSETDGSRGLNVQPLQGGGGAPHLGGSGREVEVGVS